MSTFKHFVKAHWTNRQTDAAWGRKQELPAPCQSIVQPANRCSAFLYTVLMSTNRDIANLSITIVKTLVKMAGFGPVADMIDGGQECLNLLADIKNDALGKPNAEMIRTLKGAINSELNTIQDTLQQDGLSRKQIKNAVAQLSDTAGQTIKSLAEDNDALIHAVQQPEHFIEHLKATPYHFRTTQARVCRPTTRNSSIKSRRNSLPSHLGPQTSNTSLSRACYAASLLWRPVSNMLSKRYTKPFMQKRKASARTHGQTNRIYRRSSNQTARQNTFTTRRFDTGTRPAPLSHSLAAITRKVATIHSKKLYSSRL